MNFNGCACSENESYEVSKKPSRLKRFYVFPVIVMLLTLISYSRILSGKSAWESFIH